MTNIEASTSALAKALRLGASIYEASQIPVLNNMRIAVEKGRASLIFTGVDVWLTTTIPATADAICATTLPAALFARAAGSLEGDSLTLSVNAERASLQGGRARFQLPTLPVDGFPLPQIDDVPECVAIAVAEELGAALSGIAYAAPIDGIMHVQAVRIDASSEGCGIELATFDGKRMAYDAVTNTGDEIEAFSLPLKAALTLAKLCAEAPKASVSFWATDRMAIFECGDWTLRSKVADPRFPNYRSIISERTETPLQFDPRSMEHAFSRMALIANPKAEALVFELSSDRVMLSLSNHGTGAVFEDVPGFYEGPDLRLGFKLSFLREALRQVKGDTAELHLIPFTDAQGREVHRAILTPFNTETPTHAFASYLI